MEILTNFISGLVTGEPLSYKGLVIKPVFAKADYSLPYLTLEEALERGVLEITEKEGGASVPELFVKNLGNTDVIILEGEEVRGAKQNRIVNTTIIVQAGTQILIPVSCVERGRWRYVSDRFVSGRSVLYPSLRRSSHKRVTESLRHRGSYDSDQGEIWSKIAEKAPLMSVSSDTEALSDVTDAYLSPEVEERIVTEIPHLEGQVGFLAFINGGFAGGDIFGSPDLCRKQMRKLMRGYYLDAVDSHARFPQIEAERVLSQIPEGRQEHFASVGKGEEVRFESSEVQGAWRLVDDKVPHLTVFPRD